MIKAIFSGRIRALSETESVDTPQIFSPFTTDTKGQTLYEKLVEGKFLLGSGQEEP